MSESHYEIGPLEELQDVEVDQGALINILARYPGPFDVLRELIQNADDAEASTIRVHFQNGEAERFQPSNEYDVSKFNVCKCIVQNDGNPFKTEDWERLGKIARGNDNSEKVGAFGVGFYSVLSKSDRPLVKSNGKSLQFVKGEDGKLRKRFDNCSTDSWTSIELELQKSEPLLKLDDLTRFLVSSIAFLTNICTASIYLEGHRVLHIQKSCEPSSGIPIPVHLKQTTPTQTLTIESIQRTVQRITIDAAEWAFASSSVLSSSPDCTADTIVERSARSGEDDTAHTLQCAETILQENAITHDLYTAMTRVNLPSDSGMRRGVESSMKSLPSAFKCKVVYFNSEQNDSLASINKSQLHKAKRLACLFFGPEGIVPGEENGRIFIGQSTNQTTGIGLHISAHFLPTMERGSIDLANGQIAAWNHEVLWVGGLLARIIYEQEMHITQSKDDLATQRGLCTMGRFRFGSTVPHGGVSQILQDAFFSCSLQKPRPQPPFPPFPVVSDHGISCLSSSSFRQINKDLSFLKNYRVLHKDVEPRQLSEIIKRYKIPMFRYSDIVREFEIGVTQDTMKTFFVWWQEVKRNSSTPEAKSAADEFCKKFASKAVLRSGNGVEVALKNIKYFTFFPLPDDLSPLDNLYVDVASGTPTRDAVECFGWAQLSLLHWLKYACAQVQQLASNGDKDVGSRVSRTLVQFALVEDLTATEWNEVADLMKDIECIPTNMGLKPPADSYFDEADILQNLPVARESEFMNIPLTYIADPEGFRYKPTTVNPNHVRIVLMLLRVRQKMEWKQMIEGLQAGTSEESNERLLLFLAIIHKGVLTEDQINDLKMKTVFYSNRGRVSGSELHFPNEDIQKLGLPILALPNGIASLQNTVDPSFAMEPFLESLGIQRYPTLEKVIAQAASDEPEVQQSALRYLLSNLETRYDAYKPDDFVDVAFIPTKNGSLARPKEVFGSSVWEKLGFKQASEAMHRDLSRLGVKDDPSVDTILGYLKTPERTLLDMDTATTWFEHLSVYGKFSILELREQFSTIPFVPVKTPSSSSSEPSTIKYLAPRECFITSSDTKEHYRNVFPFVDFGQKGNSFLESCCAKKSPNASDIIHKIVEDPQRYLKDLGNDTNLYLEDLRTIASRFDSISEDDKRAMQAAPMFLAFRRHKDGGELLPVYRVVIHDWEGRDFGDYVFLAPKEDAIEKMYHKMGSQFLGAYVQHDIKPSAPLANHEAMLSPEQVVRRVRCFMRQRDKSEKTEVCFYDEGSTDSFHVKACKTLTMQKTFAPPLGVMADGEERTRVAEPVLVNAGFELGESELTLWVVKGSIESVELRNDIAVALCRVLLKTFGPNDVFLLASLIATDDKSLDGYYGNETKSAPSVPVAKEASRKKVRVEIRLPLHLAKAAMVIGIRPKGWTSSGQRTVSPEEDLQRAVALCRSSDPDNQPDFSAPCQPRHTNFKKHNSRCKEAHKIRLKEKRDLQDECTQIKFFLAQNTRSQYPPQAAIEEFAKLISNLALVFNLEASESCYIFWKDNDEDLMAFNRDQKYIFFNLAHYYKFFFNKGVEEKKVIIEWFLVMAHEIAHNVTLDHDEYHGSLTSRLVVTYLPMLHKPFEAKLFAEDVKLP